MFTWPCQGIFPGSQCSNIAPPVDSSHPWKWRIATTAHWSNDHSLGRFMVYPPQAIGRRFPLSHFCWTKKIVIQTYLFPPPHKPPQLWAPFWKSCLLFSEWKSQSRRFSSPIHVYCRQVLPWLSSRLPKHNHRTWSSWGCRSHWGLNVCMEAKSMLV